MKPNRFRKVLLIDDNEIDNFINERMISSSHFSEEVIVKTSTDEAIAYLRSLTASDDFPRIIFLDLNMPGRDGFEFLKDFESLDPSLKDIARIVVLSSSISPEDIDKASTNPHVFKYVNKPLSEKYLDAIELN
jgi:CheY-like chemotaxis protein